MLTGVKKHSPMTCRHGVSHNLVDI